jgi:hypothetical protein
MHHGGDQKRSRRDPSSCERRDMVRGETKWCDVSVYNQPDLRSATTHVFLMSWKICWVCRQNRDNSICGAVWL